MPHALKFIVAGGLIAWMAASGKLDPGALAVLAAPARLFVLASLVFAAIWVNNLRWNLLLAAKGFRVSARQTLTLTLVGILFNFALPGGVGGDVVKGCCLVKAVRQNRAAVAATLLVDRLAGLCALVALPAVILLAGCASPGRPPELRALSVAAGGAFMLVAALTVLAFSRSLKDHPRVVAALGAIPLGALFQRVHEAVYAYRRHPRVLLLALVLSGVSQFLLILFFWCFAALTGAPAVSFGVYLAVVPLGLLSTALPVVPAGVGVGQAAFYALFRLYPGSDCQVGPTALTALQILLIGWGLVGAGCYVLKRPAATGPDDGPATAISRSSEG